MTKTFALKVANRTPQLLALLPDYVWPKVAIRSSSVSILTEPVLEIEDNGRGPAEAEKKTGRNGLRNMRKRMEDVGGSFSIGPAPEHGTLVRLTAPLAKN